MCIGNPKFSEPMVSPASATRKTTTAAQEESQNKKTSLPCFPTSEGAKGADAPQAVGPEAPQSVVTGESKPTVVYFGETYRLSCRV